MSGRPISVSDGPETGETRPHPEVHAAATGAAAPAGEDTELRRARAAGWRAVDLTWERLQEAAPALLAETRAAEAVAAWHRAARIARWRFARRDPRRVTSLANLAFADRLMGREARARRRYARAIRLWQEVPAWIEGVEPARRARSSLFHMRMEAKHWETYRANMRTRLARFAAETGECLAALAEDRPPPHRLLGRWRAEKPGVFDDTRKLLAAALLVAAPEP